MKAAPAVVDFESVIEDVDQVVLGCNDPRMTATGPTGAHLEALFGDFVVYRTAAGKEWRLPWEVATHVKLHGSSITEILAGMYVLSL